MAGNMKNTYQAYKEKRNNLRIGKINAVPAGNRKIGKMNKRENSSEYAGTPKTNQNESARDVLRKEFTRKK